MKNFMLLFFVLSFFSAQSQDGYHKHKVAKSETVTQIAQKYKVTPSDIYRLNPDAQAGIKLDQILLIPQNVRPQTQSHTVVQGETLYSIAKKNGVSVELLKQANPSVAKDGLKTGQQIRIPGTVEASMTPVKQPQKPAIVSQHLVKQGETKFSIAKMYGLSVGELERQNPGIASGLATGATLNIVSETRPATEKDAVVERPKGSVYQIDEPGKSTTEVIRTTKRVSYNNYEVKPKETLFSITQQFGVTQEELLLLNPELKDGLKNGMIIKIPGKSTMTLITEKDFKDLSTSISAAKRRELVLLLPFNASKISSDTTNSAAARLKKDAFLNMTLDFYSGALMAIDSAKTLGLNVNVRILDSQESKSSSGVGQLIQSQNLRKADVLIGPFYQEHAEKAAMELSADSVIVISPLSKESVKSSPNLYQAMPSERYTKKAMLDYLVSKNGNIIVVNDPKRVTNREYISQNYSMVKFAAMDGSGNLSAEGLRQSLVKDKTNYIILDTEKTGMILATTNVLLAENANFPIQLAIIEPNETLDFEEISMKRLTILKLLYPSVTRENESEQAMQFRNTYKEKNKIYPSQYATRGFDITFDTLLRLSQANGFAYSANEHRSEQVESKFDYIQKEDQGHINKGVYLLQFNEDLTVKLAE